MTRYPVGHISTHHDGTQWKKVGPNEWRQVSNAEPTTAAQPSPARPLKGRDGYPLTLYQGNDARTMHTSPEGGSEYGIYVTPRRGYAQRYGRNVHRTWAAIRNPKMVESKAEISPKNLTPADINALRAKGYDAIVVTSSDVAGASEIVLFGAESLISHGDLNRYSQLKNEAAEHDYQQSLAKAADQLGLFGGPAAPSGDQHRVKAHVRRTKHGDVFVPEHQRVSRGRRAVVRAPRATRRAPKGDHPSLFDAELPDTPHHPEHEHEHDDHPTRGTPTPEDAALVADLTDLDRFEAVHEQVSHHLRRIHARLNDWDYALAYQGAERGKRIRELEQLRADLDRALPEPGEGTLHLGVRFHNTADSLRYAARGLVSDAIAMRHRQLSTARGRDLAHLRQSYRSMDPAHRGLQLNSIGNVSAGDKYITLARTSPYGAGDNPRDQWEPRIAKVRDDLTAQVADLRQLPQAHRDNFEDAGTRVMVYAGVDAWDAAARAGMDQGTTPTVEMFWGSLYQRDEMEGHASLLHELGHCADFIAAQTHHEGKGNRIHRARRQLMAEWVNHLQDQGAIARNMDRPQPESDPDNDLQTPEWRAAHEEWFAEAYRWVYADGSSMLTVLGEQDLDIGETRAFFDSLVS